MTGDQEHIPVWLKVGYAELGQRRGPPGVSNPRIEAYNNATTLKGYDDKISWCSSFVNWCLEQAGVEGTRSALARSWLEWGHGIKAPIPGCIVVVTRGGADSWKGHCGFFVEDATDDFVLLGGNQDEEVKLKAYPKTAVLGLRQPKNNQVS